MMFEKFNIANKVGIMANQENIIRSKSKLGASTYNSVIEVIINRLKTNSDNTCLIDSTIDRNWSKQQVLDSSLNFAYYLINDCGVKKGDVVCFVADNSDVHAIAFLGVLASGAVYCSIEEKTSEEEIRIFMGILKPVIMVSTDTNRLIIKKILDGGSSFKMLGLHRSFIVVSKERKIDIVENIFERPKKTNFDLPRANGLDDVATIVMTSGTNGRSKAVKKTNRNLLSEFSGSRKNQDELVESKLEEIVLSKALCLVSGQNILLIGIICGAQMVILRDEGPFDEVFAAIHKYGITTVFLTPYHLNFMSKYCDRDYLKSLRNVSWIGSSLTEVAHKAVLDKFGFPNFQNGNLLDRWKSVNAINLV